MKTLTGLLVGVLVLTPVPAAFADEAAPITIRDALALATALRNLDGRMQVVKQAGGAEGTVMVPWEFGSGALRLRIANDLALVTAVEKKAEDARVAIVKEVLRKMGPGAVGFQQGTPEYDDFMRQYNEVLDGPAPGARDLSRIKASELKLDKNEIPVTVLQALRPILDADQ
jgi:hypothetical protein